MTVAANAAVLAAQYNAINQYVITGRTLTDNASAHFTPDGRTGWKALIKEFGVQSIGAEMLELEAA